MKISKLVKTLLISTALFTAATPAYASYSKVPISNTLTASFKVNAAEYFNLKWTDSSGTNLVTDILPEETVLTGAKKNLYIKANTSKSYEYAVLFTITRTDGTAITEDDIKIIEDTTDGPRSLNGNVESGKLQILSKARNIASATDQQLNFEVEYITAGTYKIDTFAVDLPR